MELGAGTGLVSLALARLLPQLGVHDAKVVATDYDDAVLENLRANITANFSSAIATNWSPTTVGLLTSSRRRWKALVAYQARKAVINAAIDRLLLAHA